MTTPQANRAAFRDRARNRRELRPSVEARAAANHASELTGLNYLNSVAVRVADEADPVPALAHAVGRLLGLDPLLAQLRERRVEVGGGDRDVVVAGAQLVGVDAVVVGELEAVLVAGQAHEDVDRLFADRHPAALLEAERLVERDGAVDVADAVAGVDERGHRPIMPYAGHARRATSATSASLRSCTAASTGLPSHADANPHCVHSESCSRGKCRAASSMRASSSSAGSISARLVDTRPRATTLSSGTSRRGSNDPER